MVTDAMASVLLHSADLLRIDLDGAFILLPAIVDALELVLPSRDVKIRYYFTVKVFTRHFTFHYFFRSYVNRVELRRASIHLLLAALAIPLHFHVLYTLMLLLCH